MARRVPHPGDDDAPRLPSTPLQDELCRRSHAIVTALEAIVGDAGRGLPLPGSDLRAVTDQIEALREALAFADAIAPLGRPERPTAG